MTARHGGGRQLVEHGRSQQKALHVRRLPVEHFGHQVAGDLAPVAAQVRQPVMRGSPFIRQQGEVEARRPALGGLEEAVEVFVLGLGTAKPQQLAGLVVGQAQVA